jgi:hypothetical protein
MGSRIEAKLRNQSVGPEKAACARKLNSAAGINAWVSKPLYLMRAECDGIKD